MSFIWKLFKPWLNQKNNLEDNINNGPVREEARPQPTLSYIQKEFSACVDLVHRTFPQIEVEILYFSHLVGSEILKRDVIDPLTNVLVDEVQLLFKESQFTPVETSKELIKGVLDGQVALFYQHQAYLVYAYAPPSRSIQQSETEAVITGPHDSFVESAVYNLSLIRRRVRSSHLKVIKLEVGEVAKNDVYILYIVDLVDRQLVDELIYRINNIEIDGLQDTNMLVQYIDESPNSIFPQFLTTERTDVAASKLLSGRIVGVVDNSPSVLVAPTNFFDFFASPDDYYQRWITGTGIRLLRFFAFFVTISFTALYVAVTTYQYEMIPETLLITLAESRSRVPFPPLYEALLMETTIELLREAGARLPTKVGQTIGIVGGIVIGQAAVQAGLTSNILIIAVAISAIASFVIPSYIMSASIRLIRFGLILLAGVLGNMGLVVGFTLVIIHLSGLTNLGTSYMTPVAPMFFKDWRDVFIRAPFWMMKGRPAQTKTPNKVNARMRK